MNNILRKKIKTHIEANFNDQVKFLQTLVRTRSSNPFTLEKLDPYEPVELEVAKLIQKQLNNFGLDYSICAKLPSRPNIVVELGNGGGKTLILNAHMDTIMPPSDYSCDPYSGNIDNNKLYGVGSLDSKSSIAIFVFLAKAIIDLKIELKGKLIIAFVVDEEPGGCSNLGTKHLLDNGVVGDAAIIAEPQNTKINIGHRGGYRFKITTIGQSVHTGMAAWERRERGENAIEIMGRIINALRLLEIPFNPSYIFPNRKSVFTFPTVIKGGTAINIVPNRCEAYGDVRLLPGNTKEQIRSCIEKRLQELLPNIRYQLDDLLFVNPVEISKQESVVKILTKCASDVLGKTPIIEGSGPWNDGWMFVEKGIPAICGFGASGDNMHAADEFVELDSLKTIEEIYLYTIINFINQ